jgi:hypothetical protein
LRQLKRNRLGRKSSVEKGLEQRFLSTTLFGVLLFHQMMIPVFEMRNNQWANARKMSSRGVD